MMRMPGFTRRAILGGAVASIALPASAHPRFAWPNGARGAVSFTYDDSLESQLELAAPALEAHGLRGTFFVTADNMQDDTARWAALAKRGHEVADHTISHPCDLGRLSADAYRDRQIAPMELLLDRMDGPERHKLFAYPCDVTNLGPGTPNQQAHRFAELLRAAGIAAARTSEGEPNNPARVARTRYRLQALAAGYDAPKLEDVLRYLDTAQRRGHWAILVFHEIVDKVSAPGQVSAEMHGAILDAVRRRPLWCAPMGEAFDYCLRALP